MVIVTCIADRVSKDAVNIKYRYVINYKISSATLSAVNYMAQFNCKNTNSDTAHVQLTVKTVEGMQLEPNVIHLFSISFDVPSESYE